MPIAASAALTEQPRTLQDLETPCAVLDETRMQRNIERLQRRLRELGVASRPHLKTVKSVEIARRMMPASTGPATNCRWGRSFAFCRTMPVRPRRSTIAITSSLQAAM